MQQFVAESDNLTNNDTKLIFLPGNHSLESDFSFSNIDQLSMTSTSGNPLTVSVNCTFIARIVLDTVRLVHIGGIKFIECVNNFIYGVRNFTMYECIFTTEGMPQQMFGTGLIMMKTNTRVVRVSFMFFHGTQWKLREKIDNIHQLHVRSGGAMIISTHSNVAIIECTFKDNMATIGGAILVEYNSTVDLNKSSFSHNKINCSVQQFCGYGGVLFANNGSKVSVTNCRFTYNSAEPQNSGNEGGVLALFSSDAEIYRSVFTGNSAAHGGGVIICQNTSVRIVRSEFFNNDAIRGGVLYTDESTVDLINTTFYQNTANLGGVMYAMITSTILVSNCSFVINAAVLPGGHGGVIFSTDSLITMSHNSFFNNTAFLNGGVIDAYDSKLLIMDSVFNNNAAIFGGGGVYRIHDYSTIHVLRSSYKDNEAEGDGGVLNAFISVIVIQECTFSHNVAKNNGGVMFINDCESLFSTFNSFRNNTAHSGGAVYNIYGVLQSKGSLLLSDSVTCSGAMYLTHCTANFIGSVMSVRSTGSLFVFDSQVFFSGNVTFIDNYVINYQNMKEHIIHYNCSNNLGFQEGGALTAVLSTLEIEGFVRLEHNNATKGGGLSAVASRLYLTGSMQITKNTAKATGGGLYLYQCQLQILGKLYMIKNTAQTMGGRIHSVSSSIVFMGAKKPATAKKSQSKVSITSNSAEMGGGIALEFGSKIYVIADYKVVTLHKNKARRGGAIYVADGTNSGACPNEAKVSADIAVECFFQWISPSTKPVTKKSTPINQVISFANNYAKMSGRILHGGLLDRCTLSPFHRYYHNFVNHSTMDRGVTFFQKN